MEGGHTSTATVLFTDLVGSTEQRTRLGEEVADDLRHHHDRAVTSAIAAHNGSVVKSLGDGLMAVFESAADAVAAAVEAQQSVTALVSDLPEPIAIRIGASVGDVSVEGDDYFGTAVNEAARLCDAAQGGQILVADLVRALARGRGGFTFESFGALDLKGLPDPVPTCSVGWDPLPSTTDDDTVPFPVALVPGTGGPYIGRPDVRLQLSDLWAETKLAGPRTGLLVGEPGIGKTRTAYEVARAARDDGAIVLFGRCDDELRVPYQPFVEALDWQTSHAPELPLGRLPGELIRLVPDLAHRRLDLERPVSSDARTEEHRLFEAVASWVVELAEARQLVLVLDDIHWATKPTLLMMMHAIRHATGRAGVRLLVLGTYRDTDVDRAHPLSSMLGDLQRIDGVQRIPLDPLTADEVVELVEQAAGHELDELTRGVAVRAHTETEGNPFFVAEVLRHLIESGGVRFVDGRWIVPNPDHIDVPEGIRDVVGQRLSRLSDVANDVLRAASVLGREFDLDLVGELASVDEDPLLDAIDEATRARLIEEIAADRFRFAHALVRTSLYEELSASRRRRMHRRVTEMVAKSHPDDLASLAHHSVEAGPSGGDLSDAIGYVTAAADQARESRAFGEAESLYHKALELLEEDEALPLDRRALAAHCGLGEIMRDQGDPSFREALLEVARACIEAEEDGLLVRVALANTRGFSSIVGQSDHERISCLEEALRRVREGMVAEAARLKALLSSELVYEPDRATERLELMDDAIAQAREYRDDLTEASVLCSTRVVDLVPARWTDCLERASRSVELADRCGDPNLRVVSRVGLVWSLMSAGELRRARAIVDEYLAIAEADAGPTTQWTARAQACYWYLFDGDIERAERETDSAFEFGMQIGAVDAASWWGATTNAILWARDATVTDPELSGEMADQFPRTPSWRTGQAAGLALRGRSDDALELLRAHGWDRLDFPRDLFWLIQAFNLRSVVGGAGDLDLARRAVQLFEPYADLVVHYCIAFLGPMRSLLAPMRFAAGDADGAFADGRLGIEQIDRFGHEINATWTRIELAELLLLRGQPADVSEARGLLEQAVPAAERLGMVGWATRGTGLLAVTE